MMKKVRKQLTISPDVDGLLDRVGNISAYVENVVRDRFHRAAQALSALQQAGWKPNEILAVCDVMNGSWLLVQVPTCQSTGLRWRTGYASKWDIPSDRWLELAKQVSISEHLAFAIDIVVSEFWAGNAHLEQLIRKG
jgi:hypothetical protein